MIVNAPKVAWSCAPRPQSVVFASSRLTPKFDASSTFQRCQDPNAVSWWLPSFAVSETLACSVRASVCDSKPPAVSW